MYTYVHLCTLMYTNVHPCTPMYMGVHWCTPMYMGVHWCRYVYTYLHQCILMYTHPCIYLCTPMYTHVHSCIHIIRVQFNSWPSAIFQPINHIGHSKQPLLSHFYCTILRLVYSNRTIIQIEWSKHYNKAVRWPGCAMSTYWVWLLLK